MLKIYAAITGLLYVTGRTLVDRLEARRHDERGASVLEVAVITAGLLVLAIALIALIRAAYNKYSADIK
jgi:hypothetical protein